MKRILFVHYSLVCGGVETALLDLCSLLDKEKYEITILEYIGQGNILKPQFLNAGIRVINPYDRFVPGKNLIHKAYNVLSQRVIEYRIMKKNKIYLNEEFDIIIYYQIASLRVKCKSHPKIISYIHGDVSTNESFLKGVMSQKKFIEESEKIICVSNLAKESLANAVGISKNTVAVFNPINSQKILSLSNAEIRERFPKPYICAIGRLSPEKRFDGLVRVHKNLLSRGLDYDLVIVGEGGARASIEATIRETGTENSVHLLGFKENPYPYIKNSLFTVCSSDTEGLPVVSMESLLLGKPVVSSFPTVRELFGDKECGLITDIDLASLEEGIYKMLVDHGFYNRCAVAAMERSVYFDSLKMVKNVEHIIDSVTK